MTWTNPKGEQSNWSAAGAGYTGFFGRLFSCMTTGCFAKRGYQVAAEFLDLLATDPGLRSCLADGVSLLNARHAAYVGGRYGGAATLQAFVLISTRGQGDRVSKVAKAGGMEGWNAMSTLGGVSSFLNAHGNPTPEKLVQLFTFGEVIDPHLDCGCGE